MKSLRYVASVIGLLVVLIGSSVGITLLQSGCTPAQQTTTFKTLYSLEKSTVAAYDGYAHLVVIGQAPTNGVRKVSQAFNTFQASFLLALNLAQLNSNAPAPASLVIQAGEVTAAISKAKGHQ